MGLHLTAPPLQREEKRRVIPLPPATHVWEMLEGAHSTWLGSSWLQAPAPTACSQLCWCKPASSAPHIFHSLIPQPAQLFAALFHTSAQHTQHTPCNTAPTGCKHRGHAAGSHSETPQTHCQPLPGQLKQLQQNLAKAWFPPPCYCTAQTPK